MVRSWSPLRKWWLFKISAPGVISGCWGGVGNQQHNTFTFTYHSSHTGKSLHKRGQWVLVWMMSVCLSTVLIMLRLFVNSVSLNHAKTDILGGANHQLGDIGGYLMHMRSDAFRYTNTCGSASQFTTFILGSLVKTPNPTHSGHALGAQWHIEP